MICHDRAGRPRNRDRSRLFIILLAALASLLLAGAAGPRATFAACTDTDADGYGSPASGDCTHPELDCADGDAAVNPGAAEKCDSTDNNCSGANNEGFDVGDACNVSDTNGFGTCYTTGAKVCKLDGSDTECQAVGPLHVAEAEGPQYDASCYDTTDNDCDGDQDVADAACTALEKCNGLDDDNDTIADNGFTLGTPCTVGTGICQKTGVTICNPADQTTTKCSVSPGGPVVEGPVNGAKCTDGLDNDCDSFTDIADASCQESEKCDGIDNDGNGQIDDTFADLGDACSTGQGACQGNGVKVCAADKTGTTCNAVAQLASTEGPAGVTCTDALDNDCDGFIDDGDPNCGSANIAVSCALPEDDHDWNHGWNDDWYHHGHRDWDDDWDHDSDHGRDDRCGEDCKGEFIIKFQGTGGSPNAVTRAELLGLDADGKLLGALPVSNKDEAHLVSRTDKRYWKFKTLKHWKETEHWVTAPVPMLRVTRTDGSNTAVAYCSPIPFLDVVQPAGNVVTESTGNVTKVVAAIPRIDPRSLFVKVDGVDILAAIGVDPATQFPGGLYSGDVTIGNEIVHVSDLKVDTGKRKYLHSNTLTMTLTGLGCGGHVIVVDAEKTKCAFPVRKHDDGDDDDGYGHRHAWDDDRWWGYDRKCLVDDTRDKGSASVFGITISDPTPGEQTSVVPTPVMGKICGGKALAEASVNGLPLDVSGQMIVPGDGEDTADSVMLDINTALEQTDLAGDVAGNVTELGTFDPGENRLVASAMDEDGNRAFKSFLFSIGDVASAGSGASSASSVASAASADLTPEQRAEIQGTIEEEVQKSIRNSLSSTEIPNAFVLGLKPEAITAFFAESCASATADAEQKVRDGLVSKTFPKKEVNGGVSCNPNVGTSVTSVDFVGDLSCNVTLGNQVLTVHVGIPDVKVGLTAYGRCETDACFIVCVCIAETIVDIDAEATLGGMAVDFPLTEAQIKTGGESTGTFVPGIASLLVTNDDSEVNCLAGFIADVISGFVNFLVTVFTFGQVDAGFDLTPTFDGFFKEIDLVEKIGVKEFSVKIKGIKPNEQAVANTMKKLQVTFDDVKIRPEGLTMILKAVFSNTSTDPEIQGIPMAALSPTPAPMPPQSAADPSNTYFVVADDAFNQLFASMTTQGEIKTICLPSSNDACTGAGTPAACCTDVGTGSCVGKTVGDLLPANCGALLLPKLIGICTGVKQLDCESLVLPAAQGTCHATRGDNCATIPVGATVAAQDAERNACNDTAFLNVFANMPLLFCGRADIPPNLLIQDNAATTSQVETKLRLNDLLIGLTLDRNANHVLDGELNAVPTCGGAGVDTNSDCKLVTTCLDLNFNTNLSLDTTGGTLKIKPMVAGVTFPPRDPGVVCEGATLVGDDLSNLLNQAANSNPVNQAKENVNAFTPPIQSDGLDLGGIVMFDNPQLFSIENGGDPAFQDYLGIKGSIVPTP